MTGSRSGPATRDDYHSGTRRTQARSRARCPAGLPTSATLLIFGERGVFRAHGNRLAYYPLVVPPEVPPDERLIRAQEAEYQRRDLPAAIAAYRPAASSTGRTVRAVATAGLGRCLRAQGRTKDALEAYAELATMSDALVDGIPAPFVAHRERQAILSAQGDFVKASHEQERLAAALVARKVMIEKPVFEKFTHVLKGRYTSELLARAGAVHEMWPRLRDSGAGRAIARDGDSAYAAVWRRIDAESRAVVAPVDAYRDMWRRGGIPWHMTWAVNTAFAFTLWNHTLRTLTAVESSVVNNTMTIQIAVLALVILAEPLGAVQLIGLVLAAAGAGVVQLAPVLFARRRSALCVEQYRPRAGK